MNKNQKIILGLGVLLLISVIANIFLYHKKSNTPIQPIVSNQPVATSSSSVVFNSPGVKSEIVTVYDGKNYRTYSTSTPLTQQDIRKMDDDAQKEIDRMNKIFEQQNELFRSLWNF